MVRKVFIIYNNLQFETHNVNGGTVAIDIEKKIESDLTKKTLYSKRHSIYYQRFQIQLLSIIQNTHCQNSAHRWTSRPWSVTLSFCSSLFYTEKDREIYRGFSEWGLLKVEDEPLCPLGIKGFFNFKNKVFMQWQKKVYWPRWSTVDHGGRGMPLSYVVYGALYVIKWIYFALLFSNFEIVQQCILFNWQLVRVSPSDTSSLLLRLFFSACTGYVH